MRNKWLNNILRNAKRNCLMYLAVSTLLIVVCYYVLRFLSFHFLTTSDTRGNLDCKENLRKIHIALLQYQDQYGTSPDKLLHLVDYNFLDRKNLKCPLWNRFRCAGLVFSTDKRRECDYIYDNKLIVTDGIFEIGDNRIVCQDYNCNHKNTKIIHYNILYQNGDIGKQIEQ